MGGATRDRLGTENADQDESGYPLPRQMSGRCWQPEHTAKIRDQQSPVGRIGPSLYSKEELSVKMEFQFPFSMPGRSQDEMDDEQIRVPLFCRANENPVIYGRL